jgi:hypothetical protein
MLFDDNFRTDDAKTLEDLAREVRATNDKPVYALRLLKFLSSMNLTLD